MIDWRDDVGGVPVTVRAEVFAAEARTSMYPGCPASVEVTATDDAGDDVDLGPEDERRLVARAWWRLAAERREAEEDYDETQGA